MPTAPHLPPRPARAEPSENVRVRGRGGACLGKPAFSSELWEGGDGFCSFVGRTFAERLA